MAAVLYTLAPVISCTPVIGRLARSPPPSVRGSAVEPHGGGWYHSFHQLLVDQGRSDGQAQPVPRPPAPAASAALGKEIRRQRKALGWSLEELAHRAGTSRNYLSLIELGQADPAFSTVVQIAEALGCELSALWPAEKGRSA